MTHCAKPMPESKTLNLEIQTSDGIKLAAVFESSLINKENGCKRTKEAWYFKML